MKKTLIVAILGVCLWPCLASATIWDGSDTYTLTMGETVFEGLLLDSATLNMTGGTITTGLGCRNNSTLNVTGGTIGTLALRDNAKAFLSAGSIQLMGAIDTAEINMTVRPGYTITPASGDGVLSGLWGNGIDSFSIHLETGTLAHINFNVVPEPASLLFMLAGGYFLRRK